MVLAMLAGLTVLASPQSPPAQAGQAPPATPAQVGRGGFGGDPLAGGDFLKRPPVVRLSPEQEQALFLLPDGYRIEPVLTDPLIQDPVSVSFDGNGRMYVIEMRSYMQDISGTNSRAPVSIISRHEDTDGDGIYDKHTVFVDKLVLPRIAFPLDDGVLLVLETDNRDLYKYTDTNGDGVADKKELFYAGAGRVTNMEWQPSGLTWALDNWIYTTYNPYRLRIAPGGKLLREETDSNGGQWGASQDNYGKMWFVDAGGETGPVNFQAPIAYGAFNLPDNFEPDFQVPWPAPGGLSDMQGGMSRVRLPDGTLNHFTAAAGPNIYRGHRLPADLVGDLLFTEPVGRIVRRAKVVVTEGVTQLKNAYPKSEFVRSTDPLFRPVNVHTAPDGTLLVVDMYTGIIQDAAFVFAYLQRKVAQYELDRQHNWGRIWRITYDGMTPDRARPRLYAESAAQLVAHLDHPNGWWRDTAQMLLVLRQDKSVVPALRTMAQSSSSQLGRIHALWTLEGLNALDAPLVRELMKSADAAVRVQAIRASETLYKAGDKSLANDYRSLAKDADPEVVIQAMLTLNLRVPDSATLIRSTVDASQSRGVKLIGEQVLRPGRGQGQGAATGDAGAGYVNMSLADRRIVARGEATYRELCFTCHGTDGKGAPMAGATDGTTLAPSLAGSARVIGHRDYVIRVLLNGLSGPLDGKRFGGEGVMVPMGANSDEWIADVASYVRNNFGNAAPMVTPEQVAVVRKISTRKSTWTSSELEAVLPKLLTPQTTWKMTASHNPDTAGNPIAATTRWDTGAAQQPDMWFQIELPQVTAISEIQLDASVPGGTGLPAGFGLAPAVPGTQGGRAAAPAPAPTPAAAPTTAAPPRAGGAPGGAGGPGRGVGQPAAGPVAYRVQVSTDGTSWGAPIAQGSGGTPTTTIAFRPVQARFIRITQTGTAARNEWWAIQRIRVYQPGK